MRKITLLLIASFALMVGSVQALPFWYDDEEVAAVLTKTFQTTEVTVDQYLQLDQAGIECARDAKLLAAVLGDLMGPERETLAMQGEAIQAKYADVDRYFDILYCKEIHDELWQQTREAKQAAYRKAHGELRGMVDAYNALNLKIERLEAIRLVLKRIARQFKEIEQ